MNARYSVGIDLGTTNSVVSYISLEDDAELQLLDIPQIIQPGQIESRRSLPSFLYLPRQGELDLLQTPFASDPAGGVVGVYARTQAAENPQRVVVAAKSWLCHGDVSPTQPVLPWQSPPEVNKVSAYDCTVRFLTHLVAAWNAKHPDDPLTNQQVVLTVPASFAPAARDLTHQAAIAAGLPESFVLLEEPQAAVYRWLAQQGERWRDTLKPDDVLLVVDVGGGTTDLTLVGVRQSDGALQLERLAVGNHLLVGGDNMDLALAHYAGGKFAADGHDLDPWQSVSLWHACRDAKEALLRASGPKQHTIAVLGRGSSLIGGTITTELQRDEASKLVTEGFFPRCNASDRPQSQVASGFQDIGLPYESDAAITKHVAAFLSEQGGDLQQQSRQPTHVLFNGGVFRSDVLRERMFDTLCDWCGQSPTLLGGPEDLDTSVAIGAAYYGWNKHRGGVRIRGGIAMSYYVGIETAGLAIPGVPRPLRALCVAPKAMEEGTQAVVPGAEVGVLVGKPAKFRFFASSVRPDDEAGTQLSRWSADELVETESITVSLSSDSASDQTFVPVHFVSRITELGMFELWCHAKHSDDQWKMEFNTRQS